MGCILRACTRDSQLAERLTGARKDVMEEFRGGERRGRVVLGARLVSREAGCNPSRHCLLSHKSTQKPTAAGQHRRATGSPSQQALESIAQLE